MMWCIDSGVVLYCVVFSLFLVCFIGIFQGFHLDISFNTWGFVQRFHSMLEDLISFNILGV